MVRGIQASRQNRPMYLMRRGAVDAPINYRYTTREVEPLLTVEDAVAEALRVDGYVIEVKDGSKDLGDMRGPP